MKNIARIVLLLVFGLTAFLAWRSVHVKFDYDFEKFFPGDDPDTRYFFEYREKFSSDNDFVLIGLENKRGIFDADFIRRTDSLIAQVERIPYITRVSSITNYTEPVMPSFGMIPFMRPAIHKEDPSLWSEDSARIFSDPLLVGTLISKDGKAICIVADTKPYISKKASDSLAVMMEEVLADEQFDGIYMAGRSTGQSYYVKLMETELLFFALTSMILVVVFLYFSFRTFWGIWVPVLVVLFTAVWIVGVMELVGEGINLVLTILPTIMFVVGMSDVVHIIAKYMDELRDGFDKTAALKKTYKEVALPTFLTSFTTAIGFLSLLTSSIEPVRDFGIFTAIGVMLAYVLAYTVLPAVLILRPVPKVSPRIEKPNFWDKKLPLLYEWISKKRKAILWMSLFISILSLWGISQIRLNNYLLEDLDEENELRKEFSFFAERFSGVRPFEMAIEVKAPLNDSMPVALSVLRDIEKLEVYLHKEYGIGFLISPVTIVKSVNKSLNGGRKEKFVLPTEAEELHRIYKLLDRFKSAKAFAMVCADGGKTLRISGKSEDFGSMVFRAKNQDLDAFFKTEMDTTVMEYHITGTASLIDKNNAQVAGGIVWGLLISFGVIAVIVGLMFWNWRMVILSLIPNIIPILMIGGMMGAFGIDLKVSTSMIFTISFGIAVDDTIHFISRLRIELSRGLSMSQAIRQTFLTTGKAIFLTTIILSGGFLTLVFSEFLGTFYLGLLVGLTLIFAVICDLILLPALLMVFMKEKETEKK